MRPAAGRTIASSPSFGVQSSLVLLFSVFVPPSPTAPHGSDAEDKRQKKRAEYQSETRTRSKAGVPPLQIDVFWRAIAQLVHKNRAKPDESYAGSGGYERFPFPPNHRSPSDFTPNYPDCPLVFCGVRHSSAVPAVTDASASMMVLPQAESKPSISILDRT